MYPHTIVTEGLAFPEGPVAMDDGSVLVVELLGECVTRVMPDGRKFEVARCGGSPNGAAIGPDGALYVCNSGGLVGRQIDGLWVPLRITRDHQGRIERIDLATGKVERLYDSCDGRRLSSPNDLVFDRDGGFWFTDLGTHIDDAVTYGGLYYARADGSAITRAVRGPNMNGVGLSPDGRTVYAALTHERLLLAFDITGPGTVAPSPPRQPGRVVASFPGRILLDSLAVEADGRIAQATLLDRPGVASVDPASGDVEWFDFPDSYTTNIAFGGDDMMDAWVTLSTTGRLARCRWPRPGLRLAFNG